MQHQWQLVWLVEVTLLALPEDVVVVVQFIPWVNWDEPPLSIFSMSRVIESRIGSTGFDELLPGLEA